MNVNLNGQDFPRNLSELELYWLNLILPEDKPGYKIYRDKISKLFVIGYGKFPPFNLIIGNKNDTPDLSIPSQPIIATGTFFYELGKVYVTIFEEFENQIEVDIQSEGFNYYEISPIELKNKEIRFFTYSNWTPGDKHPSDDSELRLIEIDPRFFLVISKVHMRIWIYDRKLQTNKFIPITNFYQWILKIAGIRDPKVMTNINYFFLNLNKFSDSQIKEAFINYNREWKKVEIQSQFENKKKKQSWFNKLFKGILWKK